MPENQPTIERLLDELLEAQRSQLSGRYRYDGGANTHQAIHDPEASAGSRNAAIENPIYPLEEPIYLPDAVTSSDLAEARAGGPVFMLHIDIDGTDPLNVVSGVIAQGLSNVAGGVRPSHFIGRVTSDSLEGAMRHLVVEDFSFQWPDANGSMIDQLEIKLTALSSVTPTAEVSFIARGSGHRHGPYTVQQESTYFRELEVEIDR